MSDRSTPIITATHHTQATS